MTWYAASVLIAMRRKDSTSGGILVYENIILIEADSADLALAKASVIGKEEEEHNDDLTMDGSPATCTFEGVRKLITIQNPTDEDPNETPPTSGTEITYSLFEVQSEDDIKRLASGGQVNLEYLT